MVYHSQRIYRRNPQGSLDIASELKIRHPYIDPYPGRLPGSPPHHNRLLPSTKQKCRRCDVPLRLLEKCIPGTWLGGIARRSRFVVSGHMTFQGIAVCDMDAASRRGYKTTLEWKGLYVCADGLTCRIALDIKLCTAVTRSVGACVA